MGRISTKVRQPTQLEGTVLLALSLGKDPWAAVPGSNRIASQALGRLSARGLVDFFPGEDDRVESHGWGLTPAGNSLVESWRCAACGHTAYHCPASGCNYHDEAAGESGEESGWCECEVFVARTTPGAVRV